MADDIYYVGIQDGKELRRNVLLSSKEMIEVLQRYDTIKRIREEKLRQIEGLRKITLEINGLVAKVKKDLPALKETSDKKNPKGKENFTGIKSDLDSVESKLKRL